jgi:hypothetical protein
MANRSDFFTAKLPRYLKRMIALGEATGQYDKNAAGQMRKAFIDAHKAHVGFKLKRGGEGGQDSSGE